MRATCPVPVQVHMIEYEEFHRNGDYLIRSPNYMKGFPQGLLGRVIKSIGVSARALAGVRAPALLLVLFDTVA